ncbi:MAG TPA: Bax inhibitor-1 family protein [Planctomycetota bacterium]
MSFLDVTTEHADEHRGMLAIAVTAPERLAFLRKVYSLFSFALVIFAATTWWGVQSGAAERILAPIYGGGILAPLLIMGGLFLVLRLCATRFPLNVVALIGFAFAEGILTAPLVAFVGPEVTAQAAGMTAVVFGALTLYTLTTKKDFSFLGAGLAIGFGILFGLGLLGMFFGFDTTGTGISIAWVVLMAGFVVYDTSNVMRRYPTNMAAAAAATLFLDLVIMFQRLLLLLGRRD